MGKGGSTEPEAPLLRHVDEAELGAHGVDMLLSLLPSSDPFAGVTLEVRLDRIRDHVASLPSGNGSRVTLTHAINKLVALGVDRHPRFNRIVSRARVYEARGVHVTNVLKLPGKEQALSTIVLSNPHEKSLAEVAEEFRRKKTERVAQHEAGELSGGRLARWSARLGLHRLRSPRAQLLAGLRAGRFSNVVLSNHYYGAPTCFRTVKPIQTTRDMGLRLHVHAETQPVIEDGAVLPLEVLSFFLVPDHRVLHAVHLQELGTTLQEVAEHPEAYLD